MPTLMYSSKDYTRTEILVYSPMAQIDQVVNTFVDKLFLRAASRRLSITNNRYFYAPSDDYKINKSKFIRARNV